MKKFSLFMLLISSSSILAQNKSYFSLGYGFGMKTYNNAYAQNLGLQKDMSTMNFEKDYSLYSNWNVRGGFINEAVYFDMDLSGIMTELSLALYDYVANKSPKPKASVGIGKMRKIDKQVNPNLESYAGNSTFWSMDLAVGASGYLVGAYFGYSSFFSNFNNISENNGWVPNMISPLGDANCGHLGLSFSKAIENTSAAVFTLRVNRLRIRSKADYFDPKAFKRRGFEIYPSARFFFGEDAGIFAEAFYKFQSFGKFQTEDTWSNSTSTEFGTLPGFNSHEFGINLGFFIPYF